MRSVLKIVIVAVLLVTLLVILVDPAFMSLDAPLNGKSGQLWVLQILMAALASVIAVAPLLSRFFALSVAHSPLLILPDFQALTCTRRC